MPTQKLEASAAITLASTALNSLASAQGAQSSTYDNSDTANLYIFAIFELNVGFAVAPAAGALINAYLIPALDGTNFAETSTGASPATQSPLWIGAFTVAKAQTGAQELVIGVGQTLAPIALPPVPFQIQLVNSAGQAFAASGNTLKMRAWRYQSS